MRRALFALLLAGALIAPSAYAADARPPISMDLGRNFTTGAEFYFRTVGSWMQALLARFGFKTQPAAAPTAGAGQACQVSTPCAPGYVCMNACDGIGCQRYDKRCVKGAEAVIVLGEFSPCDGGDLCADGTACTRVCPAGLDCGDGTYRCLKPVVPTGSCASDAECVSVCGQKPFLPIGNSAYQASCVQGSCQCAPLVTKPDAPRVACPDGINKNLSCPTGTWDACTPSQCPSGDCPPALTCLTAPDYGGTCLVDAGCVNALCPLGSEPFCGQDSHCKCRAKITQSVACSAAADCAASVCAANEIAACVNGACACAPAAAVSACKTASDCAACPAGYDSACEQDACVCKKTTIVPFACKTVDDCGNVNCPEGYDKGCRDSVCACSRQVPQP